MLAKNYTLIHPDTKASVAFEVRRPKNYAIIDSYDATWPIPIRNTTECNLEIADKMYTEYIEAGYKIAF